MPCATHGDSQCPPLCNGAITVAPPAADAPKADAADVPKAEAPATVADLAADQAQREVARALADVDDALARIAAARSQLSDITHAVEYAVQRFDDASAILVKYKAQR